MAISIHALLAESDKSTQNNRQRCIISIHALLAESDLGAKRRPCMGRISIHALLAESDGTLPRCNDLIELFLSTLSLRRATIRGRSSKLLTRLFLSTLSLRRATKTQYFKGVGDLFLSTLSLRRATHFLQVQPPAALFLSTLSLRRATPEQKRQIHHYGYFYPRSPCGERRLLWCSCRCRSAFLSTLSLRRATEYWVGGYGTTNNFYPRSPCGERPLKCVLPWMTLNFYPRSPCGERQRNHLFSRWIRYFYPRSPCGERPPFSRCVPMMRRYFYPRSPCGERHVPLAMPDLSKGFLSTLSLRRATVQVPKQGFGPIDFYPRSPCGERHGVVGHYFVYSINFYPRSPCGERPAWVCPVRSTVNFYPRSPCGERLCLYWFSLITLPISIHALLAESDTIFWMIYQERQGFLSTLSLRRATDNKPTQRAG